MNTPRTFQLIAILALLIVPTVVRADEIAIWNFNDSNLIVDRGQGTLTTTANPANIMFLDPARLCMQVWAIRPAWLSLFKRETNLQNNGAILRAARKHCGIH